MIISTHSADLLSDKGIGPEETLLLTPTAEGTRVEGAANNMEIRRLLEGGLSIADAALPRTNPKVAGQLDLFDR